jgi:6,7-dimethyl-8-ribityllumazine synthase
MPEEHRARLDATGKRIAIVVSRFNDFVTKRLVEGAVDCLISHGAKDSEIEVYWVAGAFELPQMASRIVRKERADGIVCLGALVRGETIHFDVLASSVASAIERIGTDGDVPVGFGVITADTMEQAIDRAGGKHGNVGWNSALAVIEMMSHYTHG